MSSSVFIESCSLVKSNELSLDKSFNAHDAAAKSSSNLVVVYGKNGINYDRECLKNLIEEKSLSTISVIRLTSPTPSMQDEAESHLKDSSEDNQQAWDSTNDSTHSDDESNDDNISSEEEKVVNVTNVKKLKPKRNNKIEKYTPKVIGLTVEDFYPPCAAKELAREILKYAGVSTKKYDAEHQFQLYVIQNDHCYTPYSSTSDMSSKRDEGSEKFISKRKIVVGTITNKNLIYKKPLMPGEVSKIQHLKVDGDNTDPMEYCHNKEKKCLSSTSDGSNTGNKSKNSNVDDEDFNEDDSCYSHSDISAETDNDRDSDLDFDVNNRNGRRRKTPLKKLRRNNSMKDNKRQQLTDAENLKSPLLSPRINSNRISNDSRLNKETFNLLPSFNKHNSDIALEAKQQPSTLLPATMKKSVIIERKLTDCSDKLSAPFSVPPRRLTTIPKSSAHHQVEVNNELDNPKSTSLMNRSIDGNKTLESTTYTNPIFTSCTLEDSSIKRFLPLEITTTPKNQLPAQISIQTHQSSSELSKENDKQLDLIESIAKYEIKKSVSIEKEPVKNIPELVKMLESAEKDVLEQSKLTSYTRSVENLDIADTPLLESLEDDIPEDLIQHVVELMEGNKSLKEEVERQALANSSSIFQSKQSTSLGSEQTQFQGWNITEQTEEIEFTAPLQSPKVIPKSSKSIIEATISNVSIPENLELRSNFSSSTIVHKEPVQIIRGNGRVITLPPIEAPTTRAKRRAQVQPREEKDYINTSLSTIPDSSHKTTKAVLSQSFDSATSSNESVLQTPSINKFNILEIAVTPAKINPKENYKGKGVAGRKKHHNLTKKGASLDSEEILKATSSSQGKTQEDDDDPKKLWCICRQPHNNRFMICCDNCQDWFHGTCVNVTKAMGLEMEQKGVEWTCPKCVRNQEFKKQRKITDLFNAKTPTLQESQTNKHFEKFSDNKLQTVNQGLAERILPQQAHSTISPLPTPGTQTDFKKNKTGVTPVVKKIDLKNITIQASVPQKKISHSNISVASENSTQNKSTSVARNVKRMEKTLDPLNHDAVLKTTEIKNTKPKDLTNVNRIDQKTVLSPQHNTILRTPTSSQVSSWSSYQSAFTEKSQQQPTKDFMGDTPVCIVCKKPARQNSIYCSDDCIRKHAQNALINVSKQSSKGIEQVVHIPSTKISPDESKKKGKGLFEDLLSMADRKPKVERVYVFERKTGRILTGSNAPTTTNLKKWLQDNPTFEVVQPGSTQASTIEKLKGKHRSSAPLTVGVTSLHIPTTFGGNVTTCKISSPMVSPNSPTVIAITNVHRTDVGNEILSNTLKVPVLDKLVAQVGKTSQIQTQSKRDKLEKERFKETKDETTTAIRKQANFDSLNIEPVRVNVRRTLKEQLMIRFDELESNKKNMTKAEVEIFATETENEMFHMFNCDTGSKYKAKYRSLMFNIKDRKNQTLFEKICAKLIEPKQLVRMSPEALASQELARWRENEAKHQLEMIKKSELDMLSCTKNYVLKTHKGEEVIEGKSADRVDLDITIPIEDVVSVLNNSTVSSTTEFETSLTAATPTKDCVQKDVLQDGKAVVLETVKTIVHNKSHSVVNQDKIIDTNAASSLKKKSTGKEKRNKNKDYHHRGNSKSKKRSRSRSKDKRHKSSHNEEKNIKDEGKRVQDLENACEEEKRIHQSKLEAPLERHTESVTLSQCNVANKNKDHDLNSSDAKKSSHPADTFNLIDQILESTKTIEEAANIVSENKKEKAKRKPLQPQSNLATSSTEASDSTLIDKVSILSNQTSIYPDSDQEQQPSSTITIMTPPEDPYLKYITEEQSVLWAGNINMIDVASFQIFVQPVSGKCELLENDFPPELDVVGRIGPDTVWDYISKIKKSPNKEIAIVRLLPSESSETTAYTILYKYLDKRKRLGVIKTTSPNIKDFYIIPLTAGKVLPTVLQPVNNAEFLEDDNRPDTLLGVIIRIMGKRSGNNFAAVYGKGSLKSKKTSLESPKRKAEDSSKQRFKTNKVPRLTKSPNGEKCDEIDVDAIIKAPISSKMSTSLTKTIDDSNEPYSPGGGSSDDDILLTKNISMKGIDSSNNEEAGVELKRKMDEINRQIEAQKMQIAGLLNVESAKYTQSSLNPALARISIPSNLSQILASIQSMPEPPPAPGSPSSKAKISPTPQYMGSFIQEYSPEEYDSENKSITSSRSFAAKRQEHSTSRLAQLSEAELLSLVPDDILLDKNTDISKQSSDSDGISEGPPDKKVRWPEPPPPGIE